jgi:hypothetical protein
MSDEPEVTAADETPVTEAVVEETPAVEAESTKKDSE